MKTDALRTANEISLSSGANPNERRIRSVAQEGEPRPYGRGCRLRVPARPSKKEVT